MPVTTSGGGANNSDTGDGTATIVNKAVAVARKSATAIASSKVRAVITIVRGNDDNDKNDNTLADNETTGGASIRSNSGAPTVFSARNVASTSPLPSVTVTGASAKRGGGGKRNKVDKRKTKAAVACCESGWSSAPITVMVAAPSEIPCATSVTSPATRADKEAPPAPITTSE